MQQNNDSKINKLIKEFESKESAINKRFLASLHFPDRQKIITRADNITNSELKNFKVLGDDDCASNPKTTTKANATNA